VILHCLSFGSLWWLRPGNHPDSSARYSSEAAVFNTTGFISGSRERRNWLVAGVVRFNVGSCLEQRIRPDQIQQRKFFSPGPERNGVQNRLLLTRKIQANALADLLLIRISDEEHGRISFDSEWRSKGVRIVAASEFRDRQESLLLVPPDGYVKTNLGEWRCVWTSTTATLTRTTGSI